MYFLSILIPVYNTKDYLEELFESVLCQTDTDVQIIALDDCSTDGSWDMLQKITASYPNRIQLLQHSHNQGLSASRNSLLKHATGEYVWFLDSDDKLFPNAIQQLKKIIKQNPDIVICDFAKWRKKQKLKHKWRGENHQKVFSGSSGKVVYDNLSLITGLFQAGEFHAWSKIAKRTKWMLVNFPESRYFEDIMTIPKLAIRCNSYFYHPSPWVAYRQREGSILATPSLNKAIDLSESLIDFCAEYKHFTLNTTKALNAAISYKCAKNFIIASKYLFRNKKFFNPIQIQQLRQKFLYDFKVSSPYSLNQVIRELCSKGMFVRAYKLNRWKNWDPSKLSN